MIVVATLALNASRYKARDHNALNTQGNRTERPHRQISHVPEVMARIRVDAVRSLSQ